MKRAWEIIKDVFALIGLAAFVGGLVALAFVIRGKKHETCDTLPPATYNSSAVDAAIQRGKERMADLLQRIRMGRTDGADTGGTGTDGS